INVEQALTDSSSIFYTYKKLIELRKQNEIVVWGAYRLLEDTPEKVFAYTRELGAEKWLVVTNISEELNEFRMPTPAKEVLVANYELTIESLTGEINLRPYEAFAVRL
ncbi:alpha-glucosidase C-terminal domain-containing protein, partial [Enterococcus thailandicus]|uniref:alpha-glucosidase C-terminal domain-containing protein n=1 Tax=Enterococcus thailandicus TaxID=417368 RepID=UPI0022E6375D